MTTVASASDGSCELQGLLAEWYSVNPRYNSVFFIVGPKSSKTLKSSFSMNIGSFSIFLDVLKSL